MATCMPCAATSSISRDRRSGRTVCPVPPDALRTVLYERWRCRIEPYWIKAAPLRGAVPGCALRRACGPDGPTRRSAPSQLAASADLLAIRCCVTRRFPPQLRSALIGGPDSPSGRGRPAVVSLRPFLGPATGLSLRSSLAARDLSEPCTVVVGSGRCGCRICEGNILAARDRRVCGSWRWGRWGADRRAALPPGRITQRKTSQELKCQAATED